MNTYQKSYTAFMESVCNKFNCPEALPALKEGFKAFCEASIPDTAQFRTKLTRFGAGGRPYTRYGSKRQWAAVTGEDKINWVIDALKDSGINIEDTDEYYNEVSLTCITNNGFELVFTLKLDGDEISVHSSNPALAYALANDPFMPFHNGTYTENGVNPVDFIKRWMRNLTAYGNDLDYPVVMPEGCSISFPHAYISKWHTIPERLQTYIPESIRKKGDEIRTKFKANHPNEKEPFDKAPV